ncbi:MAG: response regulator transcription factor [Flavobacteriales bacterium]|nr:response regulator transcription factor [Flavobacteriales bacterium]
MSQVRVLIVEDDALIAADLAALLRDLGYQVVAICPDASMAMPALLAHRPDLVLLDIHLGQGDDGIQVAARINATAATPFLFVTGHTDRGTLERVKAVRPAGFIIKPFDEDDLRTQIEIALARHAAQVESGSQPTEAQRQDFRIGNALFVRDKGRLVKVPVEEIHYAEAANNYVLLHTSDRRYVLNSSLGAVAERIGSPHFVRVHRSYLVDIRRVSGLREKEILLGDLVLPLGRTHRAEVRMRWVG